LDVPCATWGPNGEQSSKSDRSTLDQFAALRIVGPAPVVRISSTFVASRHVDATPLASDNGASYASADATPERFSERIMNANRIHVADQRSFLDQRLQSLDAYRGLIMIALAFNGFGLRETARNHLKVSPDSRLWQTVLYQFEHVEWVGCAFWDMIQPSFMFMVGVSMAYSYVKRQERGDSWSRMFGHAIWRSLVLALLGIFLISNGGRSTEWSLMCVLTQIGLGYPFLFLLWNRPRWLQMLAAGGLLAGTWLMYVTYPTKGIDLTAGAPEFDITAGWAQKNLAGLDPAWHKSSNVGRAVDLRLLNLFPRDEPYEFNDGGYQTINFIPSLATMIFGLMCGELLRSNRTARAKVLLLVVGGIGGIAAGLVWHWQGVPLVKRIWTPSWALFSSGLCSLILAILFTVIDVVGWRKWSFPLVVVGMNSIAVYVMGMLLRPWTASTLRTHFGQDLFQILGSANEPFVRMTLVGLMFWLACLWMYRNKIFIRI
jgi:predicted acyltransferase